MSDNSTDSLSDLSTVLKAKPLWQGDDDDFAGFVKEAFAFPSSMTRVTITRRTRAGRSAVSIAGDAGAILFTIAPEGHGTRITPILMGQTAADPAVNERAARLDGEATAMAVTRLIVRHLGPDVAVALMAPSALQDLSASVDEQDGVH